MSDEATVGSTSQATIGWAFVAVQAVLLITLVVLPTGDRWPTPAPVIVFGGMLIGLGLAGMAMAALRLGSSLTPTPVPTDGGMMVTSGLYRFVRHPIYTAVLLIVVGLVIRSASLLTLVVGLATVWFFSTKARWEERRLAERYPDYPTYAAVTPRFVPRFRRPTG
ncbi:MAG: isoprenylcysteine carboxylmethyltransferase family protein [Actinomycetota bacterium]